MDEKRLEHIKEMLLLSKIFGLLPMKDRIEYIIKAFNEFIKVVNAKLPTDSEEYQKCQSTLEFAGAIFFSSLGGAALMSSIEREAIDKAARSQNESGQGEKLTKEAQDILNMLKK